MKLYSDSLVYEDNLKLAQELNREYNKDVIFHCFWNGQLNEKHLISIKSCYYFNIFNKNENSVREDRKIILWLENNIENEINKEIIKYAEIRVFNLEEEKKGTFLENKQLKYNSNYITLYSDLIRNIMLYNYGGCWFDLDILFLRDFSPIFQNFENEIMMYTWANENYPNNAIYISLILKSEKLKNNIEFMIKRNRGWGCQEASLTFDLPLDMLILPCSWFDPIWISHPFEVSNEIFKNTKIAYSLDNFFKDTFCFHWHNRWNNKIEDNSILRQLSNEINKFI